MSTSDGQAASAAIFNAAYQSKSVNNTITGDDTHEGTLALTKVSGSGDSVTDAQLAINTNKRITSATQSLGAAGTVTITTINADEMVRVDSTGGTAAISTTPFGAAGGWPDGKVVRIWGQSASNQIQLTNSDIAKGALLNGSTVTLGLYDMLELQYDSTADRWLESGRNF